MTLGIMVFHLPMQVVQVALEAFSHPISGAELRNNAICGALCHHASVVTIAIRPFCDKANDVSDDRQQRTVKPFSDSLAAKVVAEILAGRPQLVLLEAVKLLGLAEELVREISTQPPRIVFDFHNVESVLLAETDAASLPRPLQRFASTLYGRR